MEKINIAELLKNCPSGMELDCTMYEDVYFDYVDGLNTIHCYILHETYKTSLSFNQHGTPNSEIKSKCVIFPKGENTWEGFVPPCQFKDGDVIVTKTSTNYVFYSIYKTIEDVDVLTYIDYTPDDDRIIGIGNVLCLIDEIIEQRLATEEEKQKLFDAIKAKGYKWNPETKTLEKSVKPKFKVGDITKDKIGYKVKIIEVCEDKEYYTYASLMGIGRFSFSGQDDYELVPNKFDITTLKPFDKVLVRNTNKSLWWGQFYMAYDENEEYSFECTYDCWRQCIPYKDNEHLLGTTDDCDEFYKNW